jgi:hypothetical protein
MRPRYDGKLAFTGLNTISTARGRAKHVLRAATGDVKCEAHSRHDERYELHHGADEQDEDLQPA